MKQDCHCWTCGRHIKQAQHCGRVRITCSKRCKKIKWQIMRHIEFIAFVWKELLEGRA